MGNYLKLVTLQIRDYNGSDEDLLKIAALIARIFKDIPWYIKAFYPNYKITDRKMIPMETLLRVYQHRKNAGLSIVYTGYLLGKVQNTENTYCPHGQ